jgi:hypothetical protein
MSSDVAVDKLRDPKFYLENFTKIQTKKGELKPFILNEAQKDLFNTVRKESRVIILKARQIGFSTAMVGYFYHDTITHPGTNTGIIGYNQALTAELLDKVKTFYRTTPADLRPTIHFNSKYEMSFPNLNSKIIVLPSSTNVGRGYTFKNLLATELAFWEDAEEKMMALESSVPIDGKIVVESTPNGIGNQYHRMWFSNDDNEGAYVKKKYGWWWGYSKPEIEIIRNRMNNPRKFAQEYGLEFLSSGRNVFDQRVIKNQRKYELGVDDENKTYEDNPFTVKEVDGWTVYRDPEPDHAYLIGVDLGEGVDGGDYSVAIIIDKVTGEEVAIYHGLIPADLFGYKLDTWGRKYNNAYMAVEINGHGLTTVTALKNKMYPSMYFRPSKFETVGMYNSDKMGWRTTTMTKTVDDR